MFRSKKNKEEHRYYLLPGMGRSNRRHHRAVLMGAVILGLVVSALLGALLYVANRF